jgi:translation initiation factor 1 (eIF-1/SUI1)
VVVQVLNGSGVQGAASQKSNDLVAKGYQVVTPANATTRTGTVVQCKSGFDKEAAALVSTLKNELGTNATVSPLPSPLPTDYDDTANCYVVLGK